MNETASVFMPPAGTEIAEQVTNLYSFLTWASVISCAIVIGGMVFFVLKYRRKTDHDKTAYITHNHLLEFLWSFIPLVIFLVVFAWGWRIYHDMRTPPENAFEVNVFGRQWAWDFVYKSGKTSTNEFVVPAGEPVKLILTSKDVIHSFYIPSMRIKQDAVPGRYTAVWFNAQKTGDYHVFCTEYCGAAHSAMLAKMKVVPKAEFEQWLQQNDEGMSLADKGKKVFNEKGCTACHSTDGSTKVGPSLKGVIGRQREWEGGQSGLTDDNYVRESIMSPNAKVVKGFPSGVMPTFQGQLSEEQVAALIEFLKSLK